ncbi:peptide deformylase [Jatrophihabitans sp. GAS493]|uniref:peptide deformylase n=1 Tax=Jatrophihabitans sp. GAS493 TaxID=1907575 RepID=UPI000BB8CDCA|nr:peptide deformylase [Jatrophihabitans sp. GAS493]SOD71865.1 peptide deformylase [Jatrophihabitans sp. GAS493]
MSGTARKVRVVGDPVLHAVTRPVTEFDAELSDLIDDMFASMYVAEGVGLAATQIGVDRAVFVYDCIDSDHHRHVGHVVNPVVVATAGPIDDGEEGCLSVPGPFEELDRPSSVTVRGVDKTGAPLEVTGTGFFARCLIHETEHLSGILYIDHLPRNRRRKVLRAMEPFAWNA